MREKHVGALVVVDRGGRPVGMLTDRDVVCRVVAEAREPAGTSVDAAMSRDLVTVRREGNIDQAAFSMRKHGVRGCRFWKQMTGSRASLRSTTSWSCSPLS
jgi:CBS domain-containing protein